jgi:hypothetical protein
MNIGSGGARLAYGLLIVSLGACSPYQYSKEISTFSGGIDQISGAFTSGYANLAADRITMIEQNLIDDKARVAIPQSCLVPVKHDAKTRQPCILFAEGRDEPQLTHIERLGEDTAAALKVLTGYAHALAAVTNAADRTAFDGAAKRLQSSVGNLASAAKAVAPGAEAIAPLVVNVAAWVIGEALDEDRFETLKRAVTAAELPITKISTTLGSGLGALSSARRTVLYKTTRTLVKPLGPTTAPAVYKERLGQASVMLARLDTLRHADPAAAATALIKSHNALVAAVKDPKKQFGSLMISVAHFAETAKAVHGALATPAK